METPYLPIFVYGTVQPGEANYDVTLRGRIGAQAKAFLPGAALYIGPAYPFAVPMPNATGVTGTLVLVDERCFADVISDLDDFEGYWGEGCADNLFRRVHVTVEVDAAKGSPWQGKVRAYAYLASDQAAADAAETMLISPSGDWHLHDEELLAAQEDGAEF